MLHLRRPARSDMPLASVGKAGASRHGFRYDPAMSSAPPSKSAAVARSRLLGDQALHPLADQRAQLAILADRLERTGRAALTQHLASRVRIDSRYGPVLGKLLQLSLHS